MNTARRIRNAAITVTVLLACMRASDAQEPGERFTLPSGQDRVVTETAYMAADLNADGYTDHLHGFVTYDIVPVDADDPGAGEVLQPVPAMTGAWTKNGFDGEWSETPIADDNGTSTAGQTIVGFRSVEEDGVPGEEIYAQYRTGAGDVWGSEPLWKIPPGNRQALFAFEGIHPGWSSKDYNGLFQVRIGRTLSWFVDHGVVMPEVCIRVRTATNPVPQLAGCYTVGDGEATMQGDVISIHTGWRTTAGWKQWQVYVPHGASESSWHPMYALGLSTNAADINGDGIVNIFDLGILRSNFLWRAPELDDPRPPEPQWPVDE